MATDYRLNNYGKARKGIGEAQRTVHNAAKVLTNSGTGEPVTATQLGEYLLNTGLSRRKLKNTEARCVELVRKGLLVVVDVVVQDNGFKARRLTWVPKEQAIPLERAMTPKELRARVEELERFVEQLEAENNDLLARLRRAERAAAF